MLISGDGVLRKKRKVSPQLCVSCTCVCVRVRARLGDASARPETPE